MHQFLFFVNVVLLVLPFPEPFCDPFPLPLPLGSRGGGKAFGILGLGCRRDEMSDSTAVISWMDSSRVKPLAWSWEIAPHIFLSAAMNSVAITCLSPRSESRYGNVCILQSWSRMF